MPLLSCNEVSKNFGGLAAVANVDLEVHDGELVGLIGPNGAGKTTLFDLITGFQPLSGGQIVYQDRDITKLPAHRIAELGMVRTFQKINVFGDLPVWENVVIGSHLHVKTSFLGMLSGSGKGRAEQRMLRQEAIKHLEMVGLGGRENQLAKNLPLGLQRALGIAVVLAAKPKLLLLDEPASGMTPEETVHIMEVIAQVHRSGITVLLVEHDMKVVMNLCQRLVVLDFGQVVARGTPEQIKHDPKVIEVYLGKGYQNAAAS